MGIANANEVAFREVFVSIVRIVQRWPAVFQCIGLVEQFLCRPVTDDGCQFIRPDSEIGRQGRACLQGQASEVQGDGQAWLFFTREEAADPGIHPGFP